MHVATGTQVPSLSAADAYEAIAAEYDQQSRGDEWMRQALQRHYLRVFEPGQRVLDVGCGTGTDALALARHGIHVVGVDGSESMIAQMRTKAVQAGLMDSVTGRVLRIEDLSALEGVFDGAVSSFAALSTVDLARFSADAARLVRGRMVLHLLNRFSLWEWLGLVAHARLREAGRLHRAHTRPFTIGGAAIPHRMLRAREAYERYFADAWLPRRAYGLGVWRPPHTVHRLPARLVNALEWLDVRCGALPGLRDAGRFFVLDLERRKQPDHQHRSDYA
jgi:SAM-dependent methyltransferase